MLGGVALPPGFELPVRPVRAIVVTATKDKTAGNNLRNLGLAHACQHTAIITGPHLRNSTMCIMWMMTT